MVNVLESLMGNLMAALTWVIELLPNSPFQAINNADVEGYLGTLNWFIPIDKIVAELELWLSAVIIYYAYQVILRWVRAVE